MTSATTWPGDPLAADRDLARRAEVLRPGAPGPLHSLRLARRLWNVADPRAWTSAVRPSSSSRTTSRARSSHSGPGGCGRAGRGSSPARASSPARPSAVDVADSAADQHRDRAAATLVDEDGRGEPAGPAAVHADAVRRAPAMPGPGRPPFASGIWGAIAAVIAAPSGVPGGCRQACAYLPRSATVASTPPGAERMIPVRHLAAAGHDREAAFLPPACFDAGAGHAPGARAAAR